MSSIPSTSRIVWRVIFWCRILILYFQLKEQEFASDLGFESYTDDVVSNRFQRLRVTLENQTWWWPAAIFHSKLLRFAFWWRVKIRGARGGAHNFPQALTERIISSFVQWSPHQGPFYDKIQKYSLFTANQKDKGPYQIIIE